MFDFSNLNDFELEKLCNDVLSKDLNVQLKYFAPGKDGGIDLVDNLKEKNVLVQVKHYRKSSFSSLMTALSKELPKVKRLNPKQYYICVSQSLGAPQVQKIYELFKDYMESDKCIYTLDTLNELLSKDTYESIVRKNFKLWLLSDKILGQIFNKEVFIDGEVLLYDIEEEFKYFVRTHTFEEAYKSLLLNKVLFLYGSPGVGKSINSKMLAATLAKDGYIVRYTTDGEVSKIKSILSTDEDVKEVILLDDCLGQSYFNLKSGSDKELLSLIKYINQSKNKVLILNSRITVLNEAIRTSHQLHHFTEKYKSLFKVIEVEKITQEEKGEIFYNHLQKNNIPDEYYNSIKVDKKYKRIVNHKNYNPRIIDFVTQDYRYQTIKPEEYADYILNKLNNPNDVWEDEFNQKILENDRLLMYILFSLTDTIVNIDVIKECFNHSLINTGKLTTLNEFEDSLIRLNKSLIKIVDNDEKSVGTINPSINDYMNNSLSSNRVTVELISDSIIYLEQIIKLNSYKDMRIYLKRKLESEEYLNIKWSNKSGKSVFYEYLFYGICTWEILSKEYKQVVEHYFNEIDETFSIFGESVNKVDIIKNFLNNKQLFEYYNIGELILTEMFIESVISDLEMGQLLALLRILGTSDADKSIFLREIMGVLNEEFDYYISELDLLEYLDYPEWLYEEVNDKMSFQNLESIYGNLDEIETEVEAEELEAIKNHPYNEESYMKNMNDFCEEIIKKIIDQIKDEFQGINQDELLDGFIVLLKKTVTIEKIFDLAYDEIINSYEDYDYDGYDEYRESQYYGSGSEMDYLEILFEREPSN